MSDLLTQAQTDFAQAVLAGLSQRQKVIPARFFYDRRGSELFEQITVQPEYYPTRTETVLLKEHAADIARLAGEGKVVVEFGSGSSAKTPLLLAAVRPPTYIPIDISNSYLAEAAQATANAHPGLRVVPIAGDFTMPLYLGGVIGDTPRLGFFPARQSATSARPPPSTCCEASLLRWVRRRGWSSASTSGKIRG